MFSNCFMSKLIFHSHAERKWLELVRKCAGQRKMHSSLCRRRSWSQRQQKKNVGGGYRNFSTFSDLLSNISINEEGTEKVQILSFSLFPWLQLWPRTRQSESEDTSSTTSLHSTTVRGYAAYFVYQSSKLVFNIDLMGQIVPAAGTNTSRQWVPVSPDFNFPIEPITSGLLEEAVALALVERQLRLPNAKFN